MIEARKSKIFEAIFKPYNTWLLRRYFAAIHLDAHCDPSRESRTHSLLLFGNHSNWWDGLIAFHLSCMFGLNSYVMMDERQLKRYRFFQRIGAFSVNRSRMRESLESVHYAISLMHKTGTVLWMYPQGKMLANDVRPLGFEPGIARIIENCPDMLLIPIAIRYEFLMHQRPEVFIRVGSPFQLERGLDRTGMIQFLETRLTDMLDDLRKDVLSGTFPGRTILTGRKSVNERYDTLMMREGQTHG